MHLFVWAIFCTLWKEYIIRSKIPRLSLILYLLCSVIYLSLWKLWWKGSKRINFECPNQYGCNQKTLINSASWLFYIIIYLDGKCYIFAKSTYFQISYSVLTKDLDRMSKIFYTIILSLFSTLCYSYAYTMCNCNNAYWRINHVQVYRARYQPSKEFWVMMRSVVICKVQPPNSHWLRTLYCISRRQPSNFVYT